MDLCNEKTLICRTCLSENQQMTPIFSIQTYGIVKTTICDAIVTCAAVQVHKDDGLPEQVCSKCVDELSRSFLFKKLCETTDSILRDRFLSLKNAGITDNVNDVKIETCYSPQKDIPKNLVVKKEPQEFALDDFKTTTGLGDYSHNYQDVAETVKIEEETVRMKAEYNCLECKVSYDEILSYQVHLRTHHGDFIECTECGESFATEELFQNHPCQITVEEIEFDENTPSDEKTCPVCNKVFRSATLMLAHEKTHSADRPYECKICKKRFAQPSTLKNHSYVHSGERPYRCDDCDTGFTSASALVRHKRIHTGELPYQCEQCTKRFSRPHAYTLHLRTHSGEKPIECKICSRRFTQIGHLQTHILVHTGEKKFRCSECGQGMSTRSALNRHMMRHRGIRPHKCAVCGHGFTDSNDLRVHMSVHRKNK